MEQCGGKVKVEQSSATVKQSCWNSVVEQGNSDGGTMGQSWWNRVVEQRNSGTVMLKQWNSKVEQSCCNSHGHGGMVR